MTKRSTTDEQLIAFAAGEWPAEELAGVESLLVMDTDAAQLVALYRRVSERVAEDDSLEPPAEMLARAKALFERRRVEAQGNWLDRLRSVAATLAYDSRVQPAVVRYGPAGDRLQLTYETEEASIDLQAERQEPAETQDASGRWRLIGQVSSDTEPEEVVEVALLPAGSATPIAVAEADERLVFIIDAETGVYDLRVRLENLVIVLHSIEIQ